MDYLTFGVIMTGFAFIWFVMAFSYLLGKYYERSKSKSNTIKDGEDGN